MINLKASFDLLLFFQELYSKEPGGVLISISIFQIKPFFLVVLL